MARLLKAWETPKGWRYWSAVNNSHGPGRIRRNPFYPVLAGQHAAYLALQLELFKQRRRGGTPYAHLMRTVTARLRPEQMRDVALYYQSLAQGAE